MLHLSFYNSDSGNRGLGKEVTFATNKYTEADIIQKALEFMRSYGTRTALIVRTSPYGRKPGAWYIKGFQPRYSDYEDIKRKVEANMMAGRHSRRECILVRI
jgi:hypothetical protein